ncbi:GNAT family N-acetyltransferase [Paenibacillus caui]|uniref:GNAT family N-acetyltransferase n=1 Tax=Paenibacillus caui TaxID=2873927 RepID=UPI001CA7F7DC|nr:GNAT family N-acetyltransferase [Paenibacillus caui]
MLPTLHTERLLLRSFEPTDAPAVQELAGHIDVARTTLSIPHPYPDGAAEYWIKGTGTRAEEGSGYAFAIVHKENLELMGCMGLNVSKPHSRGELAYWVGKPFWGCGYGTEAAKAVAAFGFDRLGLNKIYAAAMTDNPASSNIMKKLGMSLEGEFKQHIVKWDQFKDLVYYGMTKADYDRMRMPNGTLPS